MIKLKEITASKPKAEPKKAGKPLEAKFDRTAYQREYMRKRRARLKDH